MKIKDGRQLASSFQNISKLNQDIEKLQHAMIVINLIIDKSYDFYTLILISQSLMSPKIFMGILHLRAQICHHDLMIFSSTNVSLNCFFQSFVVLFCTFLFVFLSPFLVAITVAKASGESHWRAR